MSLTTSACGQSFRLSHTSRVDQPSAVQVAATINIHSSELPGWSFINDGLMDNTSRGGAFSGAGPHGAQTPESRRIVESGIGGFARCMRISKTYAFAWMGITSQADLIARVHTGDFISPDRQFSVSSETGVAVSDGLAWSDSRPYFNPKRNHCMRNYLASIAPAVDWAHSSFGDPVHLTITNVADMSVPHPPAGERAAGYVMDFAVAPLRPSFPGRLASSQHRLLIDVGYVTAGRFEVIVFSYQQNVELPQTVEQGIVAGLERRVSENVHVVFRSTRTVVGVTTESPR